MPSYVTQEHWSERVGKFEMPEGATAEMLWAAEDAIHQMEELDDAIINIQVYQEMRDRWAVRLKDSEFQVSISKGDWGEREQYERIKSIVESLDEIIEIYKERLNG